MNEPEFLISITPTEDGETVSVKCVGPASRALGYICRARIDLDSMEKQIRDQLTKE